MKILNIISIVIALSFINHLTAKELENTAFIEDINSSFIENNASDTDESFSVLQGQEDYFAEIENLEDNSNDLDTQVGLSEFEKLFVNHTAYNFYKAGIKALYQGDYKIAYENAMNAKDIVDNTELNTSTIALPFMPSYMRETSYSPKKIYYKIVKQKEYQLKRLVVKAKLISPPIASLVIHRTSTTIDVILRNHGDLPFDDFEVLVNEEPIALYEKLLPNEEKVIKIQKAPKLFEVSFKEKYGFAPESFMLNEDY